MKEWGMLDKLIAGIRYRKVDKFIPANGIVCDIGCGRKAEFLMRHTASIDKGFGFDFRQTHKKIGNIEIFNNKDSEEISLPDNSCDAVFLIAVLEHLDDPTKIFSEANRICKCGGVFVITTPTNVAKPILEFMAFKLHIINKEEILEHKHYYNKEEIVELYDNFGFNKVCYSKFCFGMNSIAIGYKE